MAAACVCGGGEFFHVVMDMFVVSGHLYRPLPLTQPCGLKVKIKDGLPPPFDVFRCQVKHPRVLLAPKPCGVRHMAWFKEL